MYFKIDTDKVIKYLIIIMFSIVILGLLVAPFCGNKDINREQYQEIEMDEWDDDDEWDDMFDLKKKKHKPKAIKKSKSSSSWNPSSSWNSSRSRSSPRR